MGRRPVPPSVTDDDVQVLLERYACPLPFHKVGTRFLGNIASPVIAASPMETVKSLWGGELPELFELDAVAAQLELAVAAAMKGDLAVGRPAAEIARAEQPVAPAAGRAPAARNFSAVSEGRLW